MHIVKAALMAVAEAPMVEVTIMGVVAIMEGGTILAEAAIIGEVTGMEVSGLAPDGVGMDGGHGGGVLQPIRIIMIIGNHLLICRKSNRNMLSRPHNEKNSITGIFARMPRTTILM